MRVPRVPNPRAALSYSYKGALCCMHRVCICNSHPAAPGCISAFAVFPMTGRARNPVSPHLPTKLVCGGRPGQGAGRHDFLLQSGCARSCHFSGRSAMRGSRRKDWDVCTRPPHRLHSASHYSSFLKLLGRQLAASASEEPGGRGRINYCCILQLR